MGALFNKITSYNPEIYFTWNFPYTTKPVPNSTYGEIIPTANWILSNTPPTYVTNDAPIGEGGGSWNINQVAALSKTQVRSPGSESTNFVQGIFSQLWTDGDYSTGFWVKLNSIPQHTGNVLILRMGPDSSAAGFQFGIRGATSATNPGKFYCNVFSGANGGFGEVVQTGVWYYIAIRKTNVSITNGTQIYVNSELKISGNSITSTPTTTNFLNIGSSVAATYDCSFNISHWYSAPYSTITATEINEIWLAGSTPPVAGYNVKYYDGTNWQQSLSQKYYDGTTWVDWNNVSEPKRWDGTSWVNLT